MKSSNLLRTFSCVCLAVAVLCMSVSDLSAQKRKDKKSSVPPAAAVRDSSVRGGAPGQPGAKKPQPIEKFIKKDAKVTKGFTTVYSQDDKWYLNINDSIVGRDLMLVTRISKSAEGGRRGFSGYAGDQVNQMMVRFEKGPANKIFLNQVLLRERAEGAMAQNVKNSNTTAIIASFDIVAQNGDKTDNLIEVTNFLVSDNAILYFGRNAKRTFGLSNFMKDRSYVSGISTYPINTEMKTVITYGKETGNAATYEFNASLVMLPKVPMRARYFDPRVGYFTNNYVDFDKDPQGVKNMRLAARWRLEPKPEDIEKYKAGELVEPQKPIVIYIDPSTPPQWVPYLIMGVNDWQPAFEQAGFKNAIMAKLAPTPEEDPTWSLEDATHSAIVYKPSDIANASGPHVSDPRSGEIIETHINWYHNVMNLVRNWYIIQCAPADPLARSMEFPTELMGQLIRFVSSHEVGHTLGLRHNFAGSTTPVYTVENLKDVEFLKKYGHATSIMDYARFNYLAEEGDNIPRELLYPCIGPYDKWAIEWGYRYFPDMESADQEQEYLKKLTTEKLKDPVYKFGTESDASDPRLQSEDLGTNHMLSNEVGIRNLKVVMNNIEDWTYTPGEQYGNLQEIYDQVVSQYQRYVNHVGKYMGGVYTDEKFVEEPGDTRTYVDKAKQKEAFAFLKRHFFTAPKWLLKDNIFRKTVRRPDLIMSTIYNNVLGRLISRRVLLNLYEGELLNGKAKSYTINDYFADLNGAIFAAAPADPAEAAYQRMLQKIYIQKLCELYTGEYAQPSAMTRLMGVVVPEEKDNSDIGALLYVQLENLQTRFKNNAAATSGLTRAHNKFLYERIRRALTDQRKQPQTQQNTSSPFGLSQASVNALEACCVGFESL